jgi:exopolyphosphatase/guanosine-5'-triphosphate,3'-diphosphate pyrophosphatase
LISIDLGSNTIRVLKFDCDNFTRIKEYEKVVRTAQNIHIDSTIDHATIKRVVDAIEESMQIVNYTKDDTIKAVTTQALRVAKNSKDVIEQIYQTTGVKFEIIDATKEAEYVLEAIKHGIKRLDISPSSFTIVDIGGGSTEITFSINKNVVSKSFAVGIVTLTNSIKDKSISGIRAAIKDSLKDFDTFVQSIQKDKKVDLFISTAGTPTTVAAIKQNLTYSTYDYTKVSGTYIDRDDLNDQLNMLLSLPQNEKEELVGVNRDDLIITGIMILDEIFEILGFENSLVIDDGLREGLAITECKKCTI